METTELRKRYLDAKRILFELYYQHLNSRQREAIFTVNGPLLVLAGAGSGKTTVLVQRIAHLIRYGNAYASGTIAPDAALEAEVSMLEKRTAEFLRAAKNQTLQRDTLAAFLDRFAQPVCHPYQVLAITFTNKAAKEIKSRLGAAFADPAVADSIWAGTFHSVCVRLLHQYGQYAGYQTGFSIYDTEDTKRAMQGAMRACNIDEKQFPVKSVVNTVSRAKEKLLTPEGLKEEAGNDYRLSQIAKIYEVYQTMLKNANALDFDDLIMQTVLLLRDNEEVRSACQRKFRYVCVDEYQDTNQAQFYLTALLAGGTDNLMVVGDDDQSIYRFRGATIKNILSFDRVYKEAKVIRLEQNYRSTATILNAANVVIANNTSRKGKTLWTEGERGEKIRLVETADQNSEAEFIANTVKRGVAEGKSRYRDYAVLYRTNAQSNSIERMFNRMSVPYRVLCGVRFADRKEIRDIVAYLQLLSNHADRERLLRIINQPKRKIGDRTLAAIQEIALEEDCSMFSVLERADRYTALARTAPILTGFADMINRLSAFVDVIPLPDLFDMVLDETGYRQMLLDEGSAEEDRLENLNEFKSGIVEYAAQATNPTLAGFLEENALVADVDRYDENADAVVMMTIHSAKGLEFPIVFLPGMEEGIFPGMQTICGDGDDMEEERRLAYVALTRAKKRIYILHAKCRLLYGQTSFNPLSRFVSEIPEELVERSTSVPEPQYHSGGYTQFSKARAASPVRTASAADLATVNRASVTGNPSLGGQPAFAPGDRVTTDKWGAGEVLSVRKTGMVISYEIMFDRNGTRFMLAHLVKPEK